MPPEGMAFSARGANRERIQRIDRLAAARGLSRWEYIDKLVSLHEALLLKTRANRRHSVYEVLTTLGLEPVNQ